MVNTTRTLNPLHFEDLEPHRFEDMVRQLFYDFRTWAKIEPTGRLGGDDGIDIRAIESEEALVSPVGEEVGEPLPERVWVIQCKREKTLGPKDVVTILKDGVPGGSDLPHGYILVAACDFSKKARDAFAAEATRRGVREFHIWGKADLEDMLFQPKYDHLLFAYFNISLQVRRRSLKTSVRARLATKKAAINILGEIIPRGIAKPVLIRDPGEERYPLEEEIPDFNANARWCYAAFLRHHPVDHLAFVVKEYLAYADDDLTHWDAILDKVCWAQDPRWHIKDRYRWSQTQEPNPLWEYWRGNVPSSNKAILKIIRTISNDRILAFDEAGDSVNSGPHILVEFDALNGPYEPGGFATVELTGNPLRRFMWANDDNRIDYFPKQIPNQDYKVQNEEGRID